MMALNESFVVQYWQNTTVQNATNYSPFNYEATWWDGTVPNNDPTNDDFYDIPAQSGEPPGADG